MNVIISNLNKDRLNSLDVDVIKSVTGEFEVEEIVQSFSNFFFNRMFLDITAINNFRDLSNLQKLSIGLNVDKIILFLNDDPVVNSNTYLSKLVSMGIYNFARDENEAMYLYNNPNSYKDVAHYQKIDNVSDSPVISNVSSEIISNDVRIIGIRNVTSDAGATSLVYMFKECLSKYYSVIAIEVNKRDFMFYNNDKQLISVNEDMLGKTIDKYKDVNIIIIDLNDLDDIVSNNICSDLLYIIEPSLIKVNKLVMLNRDLLSKISNERVILNMSFLNDRDVREFASEAGIKVFYNLPCLNDRVDNSKILMPLFEKLGLLRKS